MPRPQKTGHGRLELRADAAFLDATKMGAEQTRQSLTDFVLQAIYERLERIGIEIPPPSSAPIGRPRKTVEPAPVPQPKRPRGRPRKEKPADEKGASQ